MSSYFRSIKPSLCILLIIAITAAPQSTMAEEAPGVTIQNYVRAETDFQMRSYVEKFQCFGRFVHVRDAYDVSSKITIRPNRDTIYSRAVFDVTPPRTVGLPIRRVATSR